MLRGISAGEYDKGNQLLFQPRAPLLQSKPPPTLQTVNNNEGLCKKNKGNPSKVKNKSSGSKIIKVVRNNSAQVPNGLAVLIRHISSQCVVERLIFFKKCLESRILMKRRSMFEPNRGHRLEH